MVEITSITQSDITFKSVGFEGNATVEEIMAIFHRFKHLYMEGFPCGKKTRNKNRMHHMTKWAHCPEICFVYLVRPNPNPNPNLTIHILVSDTENLSKRYTGAQIDYFKQMYLRDVADGIIDRFNNS